MTPFNEVLTEKLMATKAAIAEMQNRERAIAALLDMLTGPAPSSNGNGQTTVNGYGTIQNNGYRKMPINSKYNKGWPYPGTATRRVLNALSTKQSRTCRDLTERLGGTPAGTVSASLHRLKARGLARNLEEGVWQAV